MAGRENTYGHPSDFVLLTKLAHEKPFDFRILGSDAHTPGFAPNTRQRTATAGVDGRANARRQALRHDSQAGACVRSRADSSFSLSALRDFIGVTHRDNAALGCYSDCMDTGDFTHRLEWKRQTSGKITVSGYTSIRRIGSCGLFSDYFDDRLPNLPVMADQILRASRFRKAECSKVAGNNFRLPLFSV